MRSGPVRPERVLEVDAVSAVPPAVLAFLRALQLDTVPCGVSVTPGHTRDFFVPLIVILFVAEYWKMVGFEVYSVLIITECIKE